MFQNQLVLRAKGDNDRIHEFTCDPSSPLGEVLRALQAMEKIVVEQIRSVEEKMSEDQSKKDEQALPEGVTDDC